MQMWKNDADEKTAFSHSTNRVSHSGYIMDKLQRWAHPYHYYSRRHK